MPVKVLHHDWQRAVLSRALQALLRIPSRSGTPMRRGGGENAHGLGLHAQRRVARLNVELPVVCLGPSDPCDLPRPKCAELNAQHIDSRH